jgi:hypothetical protein
MSGPCLKNMNMNMDMDMDMYMYMDMDMDMDMNMNMKTSARRFKVNGGFSVFFTCNFKKFKILSFLTGVSLKTTQFSVLKFYSISNGYRDIQKSKQVVFWVSNVNLMEEKYKGNSLNNQYFIDETFSFMWLRSIIYA